MASRLLAATFGLALCLTAASAASGLAVLTLPRRLGPHDRVELSVQLPPQFGRQRLHVHLADGRRVGTVARSGRHPADAVLLPLPRSSVEGRQVMLAVGVSAPGRSERPLEESDGVRLRLRLKRGR